MRLAIGLAATGLVACPLCPDEFTPPESATGERWQEADALFHQEPRWLGGDGAYSIDLGGERSLWLFGDSFIATSEALTRLESTMVRNSVAVMTGRDPTTATMQFAWTDGDPPSSFFPEEADHWFWPIHGVRLPDGPLFVFLAELRATPGEGLGFAGAGYRVVRVDDPDAPPGDWILESLEARPAPHAAEATIGNCTAIDRDHLVAVSVDGDDEHRGRLARWSLEALAVGDLSGPEWWSGEDWIAQDALDRDPAIVIADASTECSLSGAHGLWTFVASRGFGASRIAVRFAERLVGPWTAPIDAFTPPESDAPEPFVYAGKAHPQLSSSQRADEPAWDLVVTYADNSFEFDDLFDPDLERILYWPHFARIAFGRIAC